MPTRKSGDRVIVIYERENPATLRISGQNDFHGVGKTHLRKDHTPKRYAPCPCGSGKKFKFCCSLAQPPAAGEGE